MGETPMPLKRKMAPGQTASRFRFSRALRTGKLMGCGGAGWDGMREFFALAHLRGRALGFGSAGKMKRPRTREEEADEDEGEDE